MYVENSAISPWAKLRMPVVRKISTSAIASDAYTAPVLDAAEQLGEEQGHDAQIPR